MPDVVKISELNAALDLDGDELVPIVQDGVTVRTTAQQIADLATTPITPLVISVRAFNNNGTAAYSAVGCPTPNRVNSGGAETVIAGVGNGTKLEAYSRARLTTGASAFLGAEVYSLNLAAFLSTTVSDDAGFTLDTLFGTTALTDAQACFFGVAARDTAITTATSVPSTEANTVGFGKDAGDTNLQFMHNNGAGSAIKVDTGVLVSSLVGKLLRLQMVGSAAGVNAILTDMETGTVIYNATATTELPVIDQSLQLHLLTDTATVGGVVNLHFIGYDMTITI